mgnify:FL=1
MPNFCINFLNKAAKSLPILYDFAVASFADAWIKISEKNNTGCPAQSHPSRMRGLKSNPKTVCNLPQESHPSRMRGLKWNIRNPSIISQSEVLTYYMQES